MADAPSATSDIPRSRMLGLIDDMEKITERLLETVFCRQQETTTASAAGSVDTMLQLLTEKDAELQQALKDHAKFQEEVEKLEQAGRKMDAQINNLRESLHRAEKIISDSIYQANQKLAVVRQANQHPVSPEELIKYSKDIAANSGVAAPDLWDPSDPRRPYPTCLEMWVGKLGEADKANLPESIRGAVQEFQRQPSRQNEGTEKEEEELVSRQSSFSNSE